MNAFTYRKNNLYAEGVAVSRLAETYGTPLYIYSRNHFREQYRVLSKAMAGARPLICYSVKANSNAAVVKTFLDENAGLDIVSGGELFRALRVGADPSKIVFAGVGKTRDEIEYAIRENILFFTVESEPEAARISECAKKLRRKARIAFRVNPDVDPRTHKYISTGKKENKFGLDAERMVKACEWAGSLPNIEIAGLHMHIGSQILSVQPFCHALEKLTNICTSLKKRFPAFRYLDIGGGIGIRYRPDQPELTPELYAKTLVPLIKKTGLSIVMEPGRFLVGNGGILVCRVQYIKDNPFKKFVVVDAGMNDLIRPSLYDAHHEVLAVTRNSGTIRGDLVGPICESGDFIAKDRNLPVVKENDLLAVQSAGAYGFVMSSNYNSRPRAAEVMVDGTRSTLVRKRETMKDIVSGEIITAKQTGIRSRIGRK
ncbi:MAG: diaminopimelate decarboxylase [Kiritimatiellae bacterium]|nr:diaminopimelate decarboxylase [Kiritimatiellia bacterium]MDD5523073.1 diaminopimelate decarboxylase [Kiritimatiellia bacterium]